jgi:hypothetical protein
METNIPSPPRPHKPRENWPTPTRARVRQMRRDGNSWGEIKKQLGVPRPSARRICKAVSSRTSRKGKLYQKKLLDQRWIRQIIRFISQNYTTRRMSFKQVKWALGVPASARTIRRELHKAGYRRCIACPRPFISRKQAKKRLGFAVSHRWWGTSDYAALRQGGETGERLFGRMRLYLRQERMEGSGGQGELMKRGVLTVLS